MRRFVLLIWVAIVLASCEAGYSNSIQIYGAIVDTDGKPVEDITVIAFLDNVEIARFLSFPLYDNLLDCNPSKPLSSAVGNSCHNVNYNIPRVAEFNQDGSDTSINLRLMKAGDTKTFRSIDGRFLVFQAFSTSPARSIMLLQPDDSVITALPGTFIATPTFSPRSSPTPIATANTTLPSTGNTVAEEWIRPILISLVIGTVVTFVMYYLLSQKKTNESRAPKVISPATDESWLKSLSVQSAAIMTGTISGVASAVIIKVLNL